MISGSSHAARNASNRSARYSRFGFFAGDRGTVLGSRLEFEAEWIEEVERRARELDEGTVETIPADQVIREALDRLK